LKLGVQPHEHPSRAVVGTQPQDAPAAVLDQPAVPRSFVTQPRVAASSEADVPPP